jgi:hypothetical protein
MGTRQAHENEFTDRAVHGQSMDSLNGTDLTYSHEKIATHTGHLLEAEWNRSHFTNRLVQGILGTVLLIMIDECSHFPAYQNFIESIGALPEFLI